MAGHPAGCPTCGHADLAPRQILVGQEAYQRTQNREYKEILTLKCQSCGWLGEQTLSSPNKTR